MVKKSSTKSVSSYYLELNNDRHSKDDTNNNIINKSSNESISSNESNVYK